MRIDSLFAWSRSPSISSLQSPAASSPTESEPQAREREPVHLPDEIVLQIISYIPRGKTSQSTLAACCLVSWQWYNIAIPRLYARPYLYGRNFDPFVRTIVPSLNAHIRKSHLADLVHMLDMSELVHQGSRSTTARLLGRTKGSLATYIAPQANFGINCLAALSKCTNLRYLDLSLLSEAMSYQDLSRTLKGLKRLKTLSFPRSADKNVTPIHPTRMDWPPDLEGLTLSGDMYGLLWNDIAPLDNRESNLPLKLKSLTIRHCSLDIGATNTLIQQVGPQLKYLQVTDMTRFPSNRPGPLNDVLRLCPKLEKLVIAHNYLADNIFINDPTADTCYPWTKTHPLKHFELVEFGVDGIDEHLDALDFHIALTDGAMQGLRKIVVRNGFGGKGSPSVEWRGISSLLQDMARDEGGDVDAAGVYFYEAIRV